MAFKPLKRCELCGGILVSVLRSDGNFGIHDKSAWVIVHMRGYTVECPE